MFHKKPSTDVRQRLSRERFKAVCEDLRRTGLQLCSEDESCERLDDVRRLYEPHVAILGRHLRMDLAPWTHPAGVKDNWEIAKHRNSSRSLRSACNQLSPSESNETG